MNPVIRQIRNIIFVKLVLFVYLFVLSSSEAVRIDSKNMERFDELPWLSENLPFLYLNTDLFKILGNIFFLSLAAQAIGHSEEAKTNFEKSILRTLDPCPQQPDVLLFAMASR